MENLANPTQGEKVWGDREECGAWQQATVLPNAGLKKSYITIHNVGPCFELDIDSFQSKQGILNSIKERKESFREREMRESQETPERELSEQLEDPSLKD